MLVWYDEANMLAPVMFALAIAGICISYYLHCKAQQKKPFVCPLGHACHEVVGSKYGRLFGMRNEVLGILYYIGMLVWVFGSVVIDIPNGVWFLAGFVPTVAATMMSLVLMGIQVFRLKKYCSWCIVTALINSALFFLMFTLVLVEFIE